MTYRRNEKGRYEAVTAEGHVISFESGEEMVACAELRQELFRLVGREPEKDGSMQYAERRIQSDVVVSSPKKIKLRIYKGEYITEGNKIKKALA